MQAPHARLAKFDRIWQEQMGGLETGQKHRKHVVLLLSWDDESDDLRVRDEVEGLASVFKNIYYYEVRNVQLNVNRSPQLQAAACITNCLVDNNDPDTLVIIYYAGHGWYNGNISREDLMLAGKVNVTVTDGRKEQLNRKSVVWTEIENFVSRAFADVLLIFDCCYAGRLCKTPRSPLMRRYEVLAACASDQVTEAGGKGSFTSALIWALEELGRIGRHFSTSELKHKIKQHEHFPEDQEPVLAERFDPGSSHIIITPPRNTESMEETSSAEPENTRSRSMDAEYVDLRFHFDGRVTEEKFRQTADWLRRMIKDGHLTANYIGFLGKYSRKELKELSLRKAVTAFKATGRGKGKSPAPPEPGTTLEVPDGAMFDVQDSDFIGMESFASAGIEGVTASQTVAVQEAIFKAGLAGLAGITAGASARDALHQTQNDKEIWSRRCRTLVYSVPATFMALAWWWLKKR